MKNNRRKIVSLILIITLSIIPSLDAQMEHARKVIESQMKRISAKAVEKGYVPTRYKEMAYKRYEEIFIILKCY